METTSANELSMGLSEISSQDEYSETGKLNDNRDEIENTDGTDKMVIESKQLEKSKIIGSFSHNNKDSLLRDTNEKKESRRDCSRGYSRSTRQHRDELGSRFGTRRVPRSYSPYRNESPAQESAPVTNRRDRSREGHYRRAYGPSKIRSRPKIDGRTRQRRSRDYESSSASSHDRHKRLRKEFPWKNRIEAYSPLDKRDRAPITMEKIVNVIQDKTSRTESTNSIQSKDEIHIARRLPLAKVSNEPHCETKVGISRKFESAESDRENFEVIGKKMDPYSTSSSTVPVGAGVVDGKSKTFSEQKFSDQPFLEAGSFKNSMNELQRNNFSKTEQHPTEIDESTETWVKNGIGISESDRFKREGSPHRDQRFITVDDLSKIKSRSRVFSDVTYFEHPYQKNAAEQSEDDLLHSMSPRNDYAYAERMEGSRFFCDAPRIRRVSQSSFYRNDEGDASMINMDKSHALPLYDTYAGLGGVRLTPAPRPILRGHVPHQFPHVLGPRLSTRPLPTSALPHTVGLVNNSGILPRPTTLLDHRFARHYETPVFQVHPQMCPPRDALPPWEFGPSSFLQSRDHDWWKDVPESRASIRVKGDEILRRPPLRTTIAHQQPYDDRHNAVSGESVIDFAKFGMDRSTDKTLMLTRLPPELCTVDALNSYFKIFGAIQDIRCEALQHCAFVEFFDASSAKRSLQSEPFGLSHIGLELVQNTSKHSLVQNTHSKHVNAAVAESFTPSVENARLHTSKKFESVEYLKKKEQQLQNERLKETLDQKQNDLLRKLTRRLQEAIAASTAANVTEENRKQYTHTIEKLRMQLQELNESINALKYPKKSAEEMRLEKKLATLEMVAAREGVDTKKVLSAALKSNPYKLDYRTPYIKVTDIPETITDQESLSEWVALHSDSLFGNAIDVFSLEQDADGHIFCCIKYVSRHSAEQVMNEREKLDFTLAWFEMEDHNRAHLSESASNNTSRIATHIENLEHATMVDEVESNEIVENIDVSTRRFDHHEAEVDYGDDA